MTTTNGQHQSKADQSAEDARPRILLTPEEHQVNEQAAKALANDPTIFQRGNVLVRIVREPKKVKGIDRDAAMPRIFAMPPAILSERLTAVAKFLGYEQTRQGEPKLVAKHPPERLVKAVLARGQWDGVRLLEGIVDTPVLRPDGTILDKPGYDEGTGLLFEPNVTIPPIPHRLFKEDIDDARDALLEVVADFPFDQPKHKAAWLAGVLTPLARFAFRGPSPMFAVDANIRGSGKGLLVSATSIIVCGRDMSIMSAPQSDEEFRKRITAIALAGDQLVDIDNIEDALGCPSLDAVLTCTVWRDRILGRTELTAELPMRETWFCTGNNITFVGDIPRRVSHIRLESREENPEERQSFQHPNLLDWIRQERGRLLRAALTILKGYCDADRPDMKLKPWGSFEGWSALVRSAVVWAGLSDPGETRQEMRQCSDREGSILPALLNGIEFLDQRKTGLRVSRIVELLEEFKTDDLAVNLREAILLLCPVKSGFPSAVSIGKKLQRLEGRVCAGKFLTSDDPNKRGIRLWRVQTVPG